jgi:hypothetical protein
MTKREELLQIAMDMPEEKAAVAIDAITEAFNSDECESCHINLIQTEQSGSISVLSVPPEMID